MPKDNGFIVFGKCIGCHAIVLQLGRAYGVVLWDKCGGFSGYIFPCDGFFTRHFSMKEVIDLRFVIMLSSIVINDGFSRSSWGHDFCIRGPRSGISIGGEFIVHIGRHARGRDRMGGIEPKRGLSGREKRKCFACADAAGDKRIDEVVKIFFRRLIAGGKTHFERVYGYIGHENMVIIIKKRTKYRFSPVKKGLSFLLFA